MKSATDRRRLAGARFRTSGHAEQRRPVRRGARGGVAVLNGLVLLTTVQRPLATVVIGGLVTSTLLTLFVVPTLYAWLGRRWFARPNGPATPAATEN